MELWPPPPPPETEALKDLLTEQVQYLVRCPWCSYDTGWCIAWVASWAIFSDHFNDVHTAVHDVMRQRWGMLPTRRDNRDWRPPKDGPA